MSIEDHLIGSIIVHTAGAIAKRIVRGGTLLRNKLNRTPNIELLLAGYLRPSYSHYPHRWPSRCLRRKGHVLKHDERPTYHFFVEDQVRINEFMGFMIPPLDSGHGVQNSTRLRLDTNWETYLNKLGEKLKAAHVPGTPPNGRRIIFFDRDLLLFFFENLQWVVNAAKDEDRQYRHRRRLAQSAIRYAFEIYKIHMTMRVYENVLECRYLDRAQVNATQYYDFGYYRIDGIEVIYNPIYQKGMDKTIHEEKVFIGSKLGHAEGIAEYKEAFLELWRITSEFSARQEDLIRYPQDEPGQPPYFERDDYQDDDVTRRGLVFSFFDKTYFARLHQIFQNLRIGEGS